MLNKRYGFCGCNKHVKGKKDWLFNFDDTFRALVKLGDDSNMYVNGKGNMKIQVQHNTKRSWKQNIILRELGSISIN